MRVFNLNLADRELSPFTDHFAFYDLDCKASNYKMCKFNALMLKEKKKQQTLHRMPTLTSNGE